MAAGAIFTAWYGGQLFAIIWLFATFAVFWEWHRLIGGNAQLSRLILGGGVLAVSAALAATAQADWALVLLLAGAVIVGVLSGKDCWLWASSGLVYSGAILVAVITLRISLQLGFEAIIWLFAVVWGTDIFAYFCGRLIGGAKLWPRVSPAKTWSGFIGGVAGGALAGVLVLTLLMPVAVLNLPVLLLLGVALAALSQGGDLFESAVKRRFGVKDSSNLIPGHGGVMDRLDGFAAAVVAAAIIGVSMRGPFLAAKGLLVW